VQRTVDHDRATVQALRGQLEQQRQEHRRELVCGSIGTMRPLPVILDHFLSRSRLKFRIA
jgi:hypothetical protein